LLKLQLESYMKCTQWFLSLIFLFVLTGANTQSTTNDLVPGYYVVVGAYADTKEEFAKRFVAALQAKGTEAHYGFNSNRNLYYVYLKFFPTLKESLQHMTAVRRSGQFVDAWVRVVPGDIKGAPVENTTVVQPDVKQAPVSESTNANTSETKAEEIKPVEVKTDSAVATVSYEDVIDNEEIKQFAKVTLGNTEVFLSLYNATNNRIVDGTVQVIDSDRSRQMVRAKGNEYLLLPDPKSGTGQLTLICDVFGYRKIQQELNYATPLADTVKPYIDLMGTTIVVNFDLVRYHRGDLATLYNVYFYNDASVMLPESKYELNSLLQLLQENPRYRIRLHGHTNGNYHGKVISLGPDKNFFSLKDAKESNGSSMELSRQRAEIIKEYLVTNGIDATRVEIKAWGGKHPLYDKHGVNAKKNVRVEVEMLDE
jgi:outer membrane protein OmpA-like peptidoglycan-associated protein